VFPGAAAISCRSASIRSALSGSSRFIHEAERAEHLQSLPRQTETLPVQ
jgi:hypothetical protein